MAVAKPVVDIPIKDPVAYMSHYRERYTGILEHINKRLKRDIAASASSTKGVSIQLQIA